MNHVKKPASAEAIDKYIASFPVPIQKRLLTIRKCIKKIAPDAEELISYGMPAFRWQGKLAWYAAFTHHYSVFFVPAVLNQFAQELTPYKHSKSAINFPFDTPVPEDLLTRLVQEAMKNNSEAVQNRKTAKKIAKNTHC